MRERSEKFPILGIPDVDLTFATARDQPFIIIGKHQLSVIASGHGGFDFKLVRHVGQLIFVDSSL
jgi:hypothetical protein